MAASSDRRPRGKTQKAPDWAHGLALLPSPGATAKGSADRRIEALEILLNAEAELTRRGDTICELGERLAALLAVPRDSTVDWTALVEPAGVVIEWAKKGKLPRGSERLVAELLQKSRKRRPRGIASLVDGNTKYLSALPGDSPADAVTWVAGELLETVRALDAQTRRAERAWRQTEADLEAAKVFVESQPDLEEQAAAEGTKAAKAQRLHRMLPARPCEWCGQWFVPKQRRKYCSEQCKKDAYLGR